MLKGLEILVEVFVLLRLCYIYEKFRYYIKYIKIASGLSSCVEIKAKLASANLGGATDVFTSYLYRLILFLNHLIYILRIFLIVFRLSCLLIGVMAS